MPNDLALDPVCRPPAEPPLECEDVPPTRAPVALKPRDTRVQLADGAPIGADSRTEALLRHQFEKLEAGDSLEVAVSAEFKAEVSGELRGRLRVERREDGGLDVLLEGQGEGGVGAPVVGHARIGLAAGTRFHVATAGEAADLCDALLKGAAIGVVPGGALVAEAAVRLGVEDDLADAPRRVRSYLPRVSELRGEVLGNVQIGGGATFRLPGGEQLGIGDFEAKAKAKAEGRMGVTFNLEKGELTVSQTFLMQVDGAARLNWLGKLGGGVRPALTAQFVYKLDDETKKAIAAGTMSAQQALTFVSRELVPDRIVGRAEVEVSGRERMMAEAADVKTRLRNDVVIDPRALHGKSVLEALASIDEASTWQVEIDAGVGTGGQASLDVVSAEVNLTRRHKWTMKDLTREEALQHVSDDDQSKLDTLRATSNL